MASSQSSSNLRITVRYFCEVLQVNLRATLKLSKGGEMGMLFPLSVGLEDESKIDIFKYLWETYSYLWDYRCLKEATKIAIQTKDRNLLSFILSSFTAHTLFWSFAYHFRITFLTEFVELVLSEEAHKDMQAPLFA